MKKQVVNPYLPTFEYMPDGEPHVFGNRVYVFGSHDKFNGSVYCENDYTCWSAPVDDLSDWRCEGIIYRRAQDPTPIQQWQNHMWAPDVCQGNDGRFYLYYGLEWCNRIGVAVCDTPAGKYNFYGEVHYKDGTRYGGLPNERIRFDPAIINDNGRIYLYTGFSSDELKIVEKLAKIKITAEGSTVVELASDMLTVISQPKQLLPGYGNSSGTGFEGHEFYEASSIRKFDNKYYAVYSSVLSHELCYAVSDYPDKDFVFGGTIHSNGCDKSGKVINYWGNNHGSIERINGKFYVFGHRQTNKNECNRQGIAEPISFIDGRFEFAEMTSEGLSGRPLPCCGTYEAGIACVLQSQAGACKTTQVKGNKHPFITQDGEDREENPGQYIANMQNGAVAGFKYFYFPDAGVNFSLTVCGHKSKIAKGVLQVSDNEQFKNAVESEVDTKQKTDISFNPDFSGEKPLYVRFIGKGSIDLISLNF